MYPFMSLFIINKINTYEPTTQIQESFTPTFGLLPSLLFYFPFLEFYSYYYFLIPFWVQIASGKFNRLKKMYV